MIKIITIDREFGTGAGEIAQKLAQRLGWRLYDQQLTCEIAKLARCAQSEVAQHEERTDPLYYRLLKSFLRGSFEGSLNAPSLRILDSESILKTTERIVREAAAAGNCVIVGRGSQYFLRDHEDTFRVFLYARREEKIRRLLSLGKSEKEAEQLVDTVDIERADFIKKYFNVVWPDRSLHDVMLNTAAGDEAVVQMILDLKNTLEESSRTEVV